MAVIAPQSHIPPPDVPRSTPADTRVIRILLAARGRREQDLARAAKVNVATLSRLLNGKYSSPSLWVRVWRAAVALSSEDE